MHLVSFACSNLKHDGVKMKTVWKMRLMASALVSVGMLSATGLVFAEQKQATNLDAIFSAIFRASELTVNSGNSMQSLVSTTPLISLAQVF